MTIRFPPFLSPPLSFSPSLPFLPLLSPSHLSFPPPLSLPPFLPNSLPCLWLSKLAGNRDINTMSHDQCVNSMLIVRVSAISKRPSPVISPLTQTSFVAAIGCADFPRPPNARMKRHGYQLLISCLATRRSYQLMCRERKWIGTVGVCPPCAFNVCLIATVLSNIVLP